LHLPGNLSRTGNDDRRFGGGIAIAREIGGILRTAMVWRRLLFLLSRTDLADCKGHTTERVGRRGVVANGDAAAGKCQEEDMPIALGHDLANFAVRANVFHDVTSILINFEKVAESILSIENDLLGGWQDEIIVSKDLLEYVLPNR